MNYTAKDLIKFGSGRKHIRYVSRVNSFVPIFLIEGDSPPKYRGDKWHYETISGRKIYHPRAYAKIGWSSMCYTPSTLRVEVGENWKPNKKFFNFQRKVEYIKNLLKEFNFEVSFKNKKYFVYSKSSSFNELTLTEFRKIGDRMANLLSFS